MKKLIIINLAIFILEVTGIRITTPERITGHGYPVEEHKVQTEDGYILTMFRIPYSPRLNNKEGTNKPAVLIMHGLLSSSDSWILNGPNDALPFLLVDAGYDVWLGNARGNIYSKNHTTLSPLLPQFWHFSFHEIGIYDLPAMIDYILNETAENKLHYIGHSQGTTVIMILLSETPSYNDKIKTCNQLAAVGFTSHTKSILSKVLAPFLGYPNLLTDIIGNTEFIPNNWLINTLGSELCKKESPFIPICENILFLIAGWNSSHLNYTLLSDAVDTHPAGGSAHQYIHFLQEHNSGHFRQYDHGFLLNLLMYKSYVPPDYNLKNIQLSTPMNLIYSSNDNLADEIDVKRLAGILEENAKLHHVCYLDYNHLDFLWAIDIKEVINDCLVDMINLYEDRPYNGTLCKCLD